MGPLGKGRVLLPAVRAPSRVSVRALLCGLGAQGRAVLQGDSGCGDPGPGPALPCPALVSRPRRPLAACRPPPSPLGSDPSPVLRHTALPPSVKKKKKKAKARHPPADHSRSAPLIATFRFTAGSSITTPAEGICAAAAGPPGIRTRDALGQAPPRPLRRLQPRLGSGPREAGPAAPVTAVQLLGDGVVLRARALLEASGSFQPQQLDNSGFGVDQRGGLLLPGLYPRGGGTNGVPCT